MAKATPRELKIGTPILRMAEKSFTSNEHLFDNEHQFIKYEGKCRYLPQELNPGNCVFPLRSGEKCQPTCSNSSMITYASKGGSVDLECKCTKEACSIEYEFKCVYACFEPETSSFPLGLTPKCEFPLTGGANCDFECILGEFKSVQRAYGKCQCHNGDCRFSMPRATCAPEHKKYCATDNAMVPTHSMAKVFCSDNDSRENGTLSTYVSGKNEQTCWLQCNSGFLWKSRVMPEIIYGENGMELKTTITPAVLTNKSPPLLCECEKKSLDCNLDISLGICIPAAFADLP